MCAVAGLFALPGAAAQADTGPISDLFNETLREGLGHAENTTGEDFSTERIDLALSLDVVNAEFDIVGILFGGGKVQTDITAEARLAFYAANVSRAEDALAQQVGDENATLSQTVGLDTNRTVVTAEMIRTAGGGVLLEAFQDVQEAAAERYVEGTLPQVTVLSTAFSWSNTRPVHDAQEGGVEDVEEDPEQTHVDVREPPIVLDASMTLRFLDRVALADLIGNLDEGHEDEDDRIEDEIRAAHAPPFSQRDAFQVLGVNQILDMDLPPGWRLNLTMTVPDGYTIEGASEALVVDDEQETLSYYVDGSQRESAHATTGMASLSSRFLVTLTLSLAVGLAGFLLRYPIEAVAFAVHERVL